MMMMMLYSLHFRNQRIVLDISGKFYHVRGVSSKKHIRHRQICRYMRCARLLTGNVARDTQVCRIRGLKCNFKVVGKDGENPWAPVQICGPLSVLQRAAVFLIPPN